MKYSFALAAIVAIASAQSEAQAPSMEFCEFVPDDPACNPVVPKPEPTLAEKLFEKNEDGQFQLVWPKQPAISVTDADDEAVKAWFEGKMAEATALDMEFLQAYKDYLSVISQPYNDFLTQVEDLTVRGMQMGAKNDQEIVEWITKNTFVDGESLYDRYPEVDQVIQSIQTQSEEQQQAFSLDGLRATPTALYYKHHSLQNEVESEGYVEEQESNPVRDAFEEDMEQAAENLMSYGFNPEVVNAWFQDKSQSFEDLQREQDMETAKLAQKHTREAADYLKGIADKWIADMPRQHEEWMAEMSEKFPRLIETYKDQLDAQAASDIAAIDAWIEDTYDEIVDKTEGCPIDHPEMDPSVVTLAKRVEGSSKREQYAYGFGAASVGFAAMGAYIYFTKKQKVVDGEKKQNLIAADAEFQMV